MRPIQPPGPRPRSDHQLRPSRCSARRCCALQPPGPRRRGGGAGARPRPGGRRGGRRDARLARGEGPQLVESVVGAAPRRSAGADSAGRAWSSGSSAGNGSVTPRRGPTRTGKGPPWPDAGGLVVVGTPIGNLDDLSPARRGRACATPTWWPARTPVAPPCCCATPAPDAPMVAVHRHNEAARAAELVGADARRRDASPW